jgi:hypothetical protein
VFNTASTSRTDCRKFKADKHQIIPKQAHRGLCIGNNSLLLFVQSFDAEADSSAWAEEGWCFIPMPTSSGVPGRPEAG